MTLPVWYWNLEDWDAEDGLPLEVREVVCDAVNGYLLNFIEQGEPEDEVTKMSQQMWLRYKLTGCPWRLSEE